MKRFIKSYHLFLSSRLLKWIVYLIYPAVIIAVILWLGPLVNGMDLLDENKGKLIYLLLGVLWDMTVVLEIGIDYFIFSGITEKESKALEYMKTSVCGIPLLKKSIIADGLRRLISISIIAVPCSRACYSKLSWAGIIATIGVLFFFTELGLIFTRRYPSLSVNTVVIYCIFLVLPTTMTRILKASPGIKIILPALMAIAVSVLGRWLILQKARNSYYDNRTQKILKAD